jgi:ornithine carbamoyltransferase
MYIKGEEIGWGKREPVKDVARVIASMADGIMARTFEHEKVVELAKYSKVPELDFVTESDPREAVREADVVVTDTWVSMGQEAEKEQRIKQFASFQVDDKLLAHAPKRAVVLHCLPAYRGLEISDEVMESPRSLVFQEAENRLHAQKGIMAVLMGGM